jgi:hypothetical protein
LDLTYLPLAAPKILVIEYMNLLAIRSVALNPGVGRVIRYVNHIVCQPSLPSAVVQVDRTRGLPKRPMWTMRASRAIRPTSDFLPGARR